MCVRNRVGWCLILMLYRVTAAIKEAESVLRNHSQKQVQKDSHFIYNLPCGFSALIRPSPFTGTKKHLFLSSLFLWRKFLEVQTNASYLPDRFKQITLSTCKYLLGTFLIFGSLLCEKSRDPQRSFISILFVPLKVSGSDPSVWSV